MNQWFVLKKTFYGYEKSFTLLCMKDTNQCKFKKRERGRKKGIDETDIEHDIESHLIW